MNKALVIFLATISLATLSLAKYPKYTGVRFINLNMNFLVPTQNVKCELSDPNSSFKKTITITNTDAYQFYTSFSDPKGLATLRYRCESNNVVKERTVKIMKDQNLCVVLITYPYPLKKLTVVEDYCYKINSNFPK